MRRLTYILFAVTALASAVCCRQGAAESSHPSLVFTGQEVSMMRRQAARAPLFEQSLRGVIAEADEALSREINLPVPKDGGGGYTHEIHKRNYFDMYYCGLAWQLTGRKEYSDRVREMLLAYAGLYPTLPAHPVVKSPVRGRLFWQTLNESVWLVHTSIAYDCVYDSIPEEDRRSIEQGLFYPICEFISEGTPDNRANFETFNKMHNHGTWAVAAVGMAGLAMGDRSLVDKALYGSREGGGFIHQLDALFSPDGYFTEGAYYQRYAIWPFVLFADSIERNLPELHIFEYRDGIISKAMDALVQMAYDGEFFHINDALEKGYSAQEIICAADIVYSRCPSKKYLLSLIRDYQGKVNATWAGFEAARAIAAGEAEPMEFHSVLLRDGSDGGDGAFAVLRSRSGSALTFKASSHGLSHGHYDKLTFAWYDHGHEVISDYGAARFLNIEAKNGGHYTRENNSYAMTTVAHNTLVADETSHFGGVYKVSSRYSPVILAYDDTPEFQYVAALDTNAVPGVRMQRWLALAELPFLESPLIIDLLRARGAGSHTYDYPLHYNGHMVSLSVPYRRFTTEMHALGTAPGYRHLWLEAEAAGGEGSTSYTWICGNKLYSITSATTPATEVKLLRTGADDPDFNLRSEPALMLRERGVGSHTFVSCIETHGMYDLQVEQAANMVRSCTGIETLRDDDECSVLRFDFAGGHSAEVTVDYTDNKMTIKY